VDIVSKRTLYSIFRSQATQQPDRNWLTYEAENGALQSWTYSEFLDIVHQAGNLLQNLAIRPGDVVNLHLTNHPAFPQIILAASYLGAIVLPTNPACSAEEHRYFLEHSEAKLVLTRATHLEDVEPVATPKACRILLIQDGYRPGSSHPCYETELQKQSCEVSDRGGSTDKVVQLLYTSGTTSLPKGVMLTNANFIYGSEVFRAATGLRAEDRHLIALPLYHSAAQCHALWPSLMAGCSVSILSRFSAGRFFQQAVNHQATMAALFGAPLRMLLNQPPRDADRAHRLRNVTYAQNLTPAQYDEWHRRFGAPLQQLWGMTECCALPIMSPLTPERRLMAMGRPVLGYEVKVVDESGAEVPPHTPGELIVRGIPGHSLMKGYLKNDAATKRALRQMPDGVWLFSGDTALYDDDGFFYFLDRSSDLIKRAGLNISTAEVESVIGALDQVAEVCVIGLPDLVRDELVAAAIITRSGATLTTDQILSHCAANLAPYKVPERIEFVDSLPRTSVGKLRKNVVREQLIARTPAAKAGW
jgi:crotonobetaine/carnitine-CoA ligase